MQCQIITFNSMGYFVHSPPFQGAKNLFYFVARDSGHVKSIKRTHVGPLCVFYALLLIPPICISMYYK